MVSNTRQKAGISGVEVEGEDQLNNVGILQQGGAGEEVNADFFIRMIVIVIVGGILMEFLFKTGDRDKKGEGFLDMRAMKFSLIHKSKVGTQGIKVYTTMRVTMLETERSMSHRGTAGHLSTAIIS